MERCSGGRTRKGPPVTLTPCAKAKPGFPHGAVAAPHFGKQLSLPPQICPLLAFLSRWHFGEHVTGSVYPGPRFFACRGQGVSACISSGRCCVTVSGTAAVSPVSMLHERRSHFPRSVLPLHIHFQTLFAITLNLMGCM